MGRWDHLGSTLDFEKVRSIIGIETSTGLSTFGMDQEFTVIGSNL